jgi:hypothetical protein
LKDEYQEVLLRSPLSQAGPGLIQMREILNHLNVVFLYPFDAKGIVRTIANRTRSLHSTIVEYNFRNGLSEEDYVRSLPRSNHILYKDVVACRDAGFFTERVINHKIDELYVIAPAYNNGLDPMAQAIIMDNGNVGPNMSNYYFFKELALIKSTEDEGDKRE